MEFSNIEAQVMNRVESEKWVLDPLKDLAKVIEELGELSREIRRIEEGRERPDEVAPVKVEIIKEIASETGDVLFPLVKIIKFYEIPIDETVLAHSLASLKTDKEYDPYVGLATVVKELGKLTAVIDTNGAIYAGAVVINILVSLQKISLKYGLSLDRCFAAHQDKMNIRYKK